MSGIEFLETGGTSPRAVPTARPRAHVREAGLWWVTCACWATAAVLAVVAAYRPVLAVSYPGSGGYTINAWGTYLGGDPGQSVLQGVRYAPWLCVLAAVFAVLAGYCAAHAVRPVPPWSRVVATTAAVAASAFLAGLTVAMWLQVTSTLNSVRAEVHWQVGLGDPVRGDIDTAVGTCLGFAVGALVAAAVAAILGHPAVHDRLSGLLVTKSRRRVSPDLAG